MLYSGGHDGAGVGAVGGRSRIGCKKRERKGQKWIEAGVNEKVTRAQEWMQRVRGAGGDAWERGAGVDAAERGAGGNAMGERSRNGGSGREEQKWMQLDIGAGMGTVGETSKSGGS